MGMITGDWQEALAGEFKKPYYASLYRFIREEYRTHVIYPPSEDIFNALHYTPLHQVRVLILGQDPYHEPNQAHGLCFSVLPEQRELPPSLQNIYKELHDDLGCTIPTHGYLKKWADQGVLLLNTPDGAGTSGVLASGKGMGDLYRCGDRCGKRGGSPDRMHAMGETGAGKGGPAHES